MKRLYYTLLFSFIIAFSARAQEASSSIRFGVFDWSKVEDYHWGADTLEALYAKPLWGVKRLKARLIDKDTSKPITKDIVVRCAPCEDRCAYIEWEVNAKGGLIDLEIPSLGTDSFYVMLNARSYEMVTMIVDASHRKGDAIDLGTFRMEDISKGRRERFAKLMEIDWSQVDHSKYKMEVKKPEGALVNCTNLELNVVDEEGQPVQARVKIEIYADRNSQDEEIYNTIGIFRSCDKKGYYCRPFSLASTEFPVDSFYISVHHPYMETVRKLVTEEHKNGPYLRVGTIVMKRKPAILPPEKE